MKIIKQHLIGVCVYGAWVIGADLIFLGKDFKAPLVLITFFKEVWIFYSGYLFLHFLIRKKRRRWLALPILLLSLLGAFLFRLLYKWTRDTFYTPFDYPFWDVFYSDLMFYTTFFIYSIGYFFFTGYVNKQKELRKLEQDQYQLKEALLQTENNFLRAQINPHFLYNTLNHMYAATHKQNPQVAEAIMQLSSVMRYSIQDFSKGSGTTSLEDEVEHIRNVIAINKFRFGEALNVQLIVEGDVAGKTVVPLILITLVENIFKHGDLKNPLQAATISLKIDEATKTLLFSTRNAIGTAPVLASTGVGLSNVRQRLGAVYGGKARLEAAQEGTLFETKLTMPYFGQSIKKIRAHDTMYAS